MKQYKVRDIPISPGLVLSPMSGVTTRPFRRLIKELNPGSVGLLVSEFISVEAMTRRVPRSLEMMRYHEEERPYAVQIFGYDPQRMRDAALMVQDCGADIVDINCGCPAPKVVRKGGGCELMRQPEHLASIIRTVKRALSIPLTIKIRSGWDCSSLNALEIAKMAESEGVEAIAIHGRTRTQLYRGDADWGVVRQVAAAVKVPVLGSGDVVDLESAEERGEGSVAGLFIGRAAMSNPFVFRDIALRTRTDLKADPALVLATLDRYVDLLQEDFHPKTCIGKLKQLATQMCRGYTWRKELLMAATFDEQRELLKRVRAEYDGEPQGLGEHRSGRPNDITSVTAQPGAVG